MRLPGIIVYGTQMLSPCTCWYQPAWHGLSLQVSEMCTWAHVQDKGQHLSSACDAFAPPLCTGCFVLNMPISMVDYIKCL